MIRKQGVIKMEILWENEQSKYEVTKDLLDLLEKVMQKSLEVEGLEDSWEISLLFVDNEEIRKINNEHRNIDKATDVLSFPMHEKEDLKEAKEKILGDIVISLEKAEEQASEYGHSFEREVGFLTCHSMFHLMGYDHDTKENTDIMRAKEETVLESLGIRR